ncbi:MAG TPA: YihY/virulence factor BrkB family protein [Gemmatimonadaceae bacterium]|nr:YihY/virulence factor BrkB family protein [Gemmatimonadaceae bacterium]
MATVRPLELAKGTFKGFMDDEATWKAAALAYYTVFALAPLLVILLQIASLIWDPAEVRRSITTEFGALMGQEVGRQVETMVASAEEKASGTGVRLLLSLAGLVFGATGAFVSLQTALNQAWKVEPDPKRGGIKNFITKRVLSLGMVLGIAFLVLVSLALSAALSAFGQAIFGGFGETVGLALNFTLSFAVITLLFAALFKVLPDAKLRWRDVWVGAIATSVFFVVGKYLIGLYIGQSDPGNTFGAAGALAVLLVWIYYAAIIVLLGAEFTQAWVRQHGRVIEPEEGAVRVVGRKAHVGSSGTEEPDPRSRQGDDLAARGLRTGRPLAGGIQGREEAEVKSAEQKGRSEAIERAQREVAAVRERMSETVVAIDERVETAKERVSPTELVRRHPLAALAAAVVAGVTLSATRADAKAAGAATDATKRASRAAARGASDLAHAAADKVRGNGDDPDTDAEPDLQEEPGVVGRAKARVGEMWRAQAEELEMELRRASAEMTGRDAQRYR